MGVLASRDAMFMSKIEPVPLLDAPPAASTMKASGTHSNSSRSFGGGAHAHRV